MQLVLKNIVIGLPAGLLIFQYVVACAELSYVCFEIYDSLGFGFLVRVNIA
jgi:hypothetical protein